jgi:hypothetical protein
MLMVDHWSFVIRKMIEHEEIVELLRNHGAKE